MLRNIIYIVLTGDVRITLVILAAGMGSRYGGLKQLDAIGPAGETMLDFAVQDAVRAGFSRVVFVIRREFEREFRSQVGTRYERLIEVSYVFQSMDVLPPGFIAPSARTKPWGTGHAVWCAAPALSEPFAVINADDFYGADSFAQLAGLLAQPAEAALPRFGMIGFRLANTLSEHGSVSRGVCELDSKAMLQTVVEHTGIQRAEVGPGRRFTGDEIVSMNCWGFTPALFPLLEAQLVSFLKQHGHDRSGEFYLPAAVSAMIRAGSVVVRVLPTKAEWFGVTYREDRPQVAAAIAALMAAGRYAPISSS